MTAAQSVLICEMVAARDAMAHAVLALRLELWNTLEMACDTVDGQIDLRTAPRKVEWINNLARAICKIERQMGPTRDQCPAWLNTYLRWFAP